MKKTNNKMVKSSCEMRLRFNVLYRKMEVVKMRIKSGRIQSRDDWKH